MNELKYNGFYIFIEDLTEKLSSFVGTGDKTQVWLLSVLSSCAIGVSAMFPLFLMSFSSTNCLINSDSSSKTLLKYLLSFAVGGLLGDVFFHLMPESFEQIHKTGLTVRNVQFYIGFWTLTGILCFAVTEKFFSHLNVTDSGDNNRFVNGCQTRSDSNNTTINGDISCRRHENDLKKDDKKASTSTKFNITGYLNLLANGFDNLTHGLAVGASFLVSIKMGLLTTFAIMIHEIPHEIGDFAILIKSGFSKWEAVRAQMSIAGVTLLGALVILYADSVDVVGIRTAWILPFTSGGFLYIALVSILPELMTEPNFAQSVTQTLFMCAGVGVMAVVNQIIV